MKNIINGLSNEDLINLSEETEVLNRPGVKVNLDENSFLFNIISNNDLTNTLKSGDKFKEFAIRSNILHIRNY